MTAKTGPTANYELEDKTHYREPDGPFEFVPAKF